MNGPGGIFASSPRQREAGRGSAQTCDRENRRGGRYDFANAPCSPSGNG